MLSQRQYKGVCGEYVDIHDWYPVIPLPLQRKPKRFDIRDFFVFDGSCSVVTVEVPEANEVAEKTLEARFLEQADKWERETAHLSSPLQRMMHPSYQAILGMSAESPENKRGVVRLMLRDLKRNQRDWFLALSYLTQQNPIDPKDYGKTSKMVASWMKWGEGQGLLQE